MPLTIGFSVDTLYYPQGGGHLWAYLNWALGFKALGHRVLWIESVVNDESPEKIEALLTILRQRLAPYGLADSIAVAPREEGPFRTTIPPDVITGDAITGDLLIAMQYCTSPDILRRFRRSAMIDIDPGLTQRWVARKEMPLSPYDRFFTIGEGVARGDPKIPKTDVQWAHTTPAVSVDAWKVTGSAPDAPFTTISHWYADEWIVLENGDPFCNNKRAGFQPFLGVAKRVGVPMELAIRLNNDTYELAVLEGLGWRVRESHDVTGDPDRYQQYIQSSRGEFSCAKPLYVLLDSGWVSDRTLCYLSSGKPCLVQHTGPSDYLPDAAGMFRFRTEDEAVRYMEQILGDYPKQCRLARELAETYFEASKVARRLIERVLD